MAGKALARYLLNKGKSQSEIQKMLGLGYRRTKTLIDAAKDSTNNNLYPVISTTLKNVCDNSDIDPYKLYEIVTNRNYTGNEGIILASKEIQINELKKIIGKCEEQIVFLRGVIEKLQGTGDSNA